MADLQVSPPWVNYARRVAALFADDPEVVIDYDNDECEVKLLVDNAVKAAALDEILVHEVNFGNVTLRVTVVPGNEETTTAMLLRRAFEGNRAVLSVETRDLPASTHVLFVPEVVQYPSDDLSSYFGIDTTLYENIAREIFTVPDGTFFNTTLDYDFELDFE